MREIPSVKRLGLHGLSRLNHRLPLAGIVGNTSNAVLCYHSVGNQTEFGNVSQERLERDIRYLDRHHEIVDLKSAIRNVTDGPKQVALTFDDGYLNFDTKARPILEKYGVPATVFVVSNAVVSEEVVPDFGEVMGLDRLYDLVDSDLVTVGNHTRSHARLATLEDSSQIRDEIVGAKDDLERWLGVDIDVLSYPNSSYDSRVLDVARESHEFAVIDDDGLIHHGVDPHLIPRIDAHLPHHQVMFKTTDMYHDLRAWAGRRWPLSERTEPSSEQV